MSQQKDQLDQNDLLRKRPQDLTQQNLTLNARIAKLEFLETTGTINGDINDVMQGGNPPSS